jgi:UPF0755 protein
MNSFPRIDSVATRRALLLVLLPVIIAVAVISVGTWIFLLPNTFEGDQRIVIIPRGSTFIAVMDSLENAGVLKNRETFELAAKLMGKTSGVKFGRYRLISGMSNFSLIIDLHEGRSNFPILVRVPEGGRVFTVSARFSAFLGINQELFLRLCNDRDFIGRMGINASSLEGYLLPDTYNFYWQTDEKEIIRSLVGAFQSFYHDTLRRRQQELGMTLREVLTFASIVEGETSLDSERATVAGVYHNRLKRRMLLQADPTIQYAIPDGPRRLLYSDLRIDSPYNTYRYIGLPPGPINNPGRKSILATLYPEQHAYLYFVADGTGGHKFSRTYTEHQRAVQQWRRIRRELLLNNSTQSK